MEKWCKFAGCFKENAVIEASKYGILTSTAETLINKN